MVAPDPVLFCPFCRESFEHRTLCPTHELALVPWNALPPDPEDEHASTDLAFYDPRHGRGVVVAGALAALLGFSLPVVNTSLSAHVDLSGVLLASTRAGNLWTVPFVAVAVIALVMRPRTLAALRSLRLAVFAGGAVGLASLAFTSWRLLVTARAIGERTGEFVVVSPRAGAALMVIGLGLVLFGSLRLGSE